MFGQAKVIEPELVSDEVIIKGDFNNYLNQKYIFKDKIYFFGADATHGSELWVSDGTPAGTYMLKDFTPNGNSDIFIFKANLDKLVFSVKDEDGKGSLWATDGTTTGTVLLADVIAQVGYAPQPNKQESRVYKGKIIFAGDDGVHGSEPWITDGTPKGTFMIQDLGVGGESNPWFFTQAGEGFVFVTSKNVGFSSVIWSTDGSKNSCTRIYQGDENSQIIDIGLEGIPLVINSYSDLITNTGYTLLSVTDGTLEGTIPVLGQDKTLTGLPTKFAKVKDKVYFYLNGGWNNELYVTDGTEKGTELFLKTEGVIEDIVNWNDKLLFHVSKAGSFISDGTKDGTFEINELTDESVYFEKYYILGDKLYFGNYGDEKLFSIWISDGTKSGTRKVKTMNEPNQKVQFDFFNSFDGNAVFSYHEDINPGELWMTDGAEAGTKQVAEFSFIPNFKNYAFRNVEQFEDNLLIIPSFQNKVNYMFLLDRAGVLTRVEPMGAIRSNKFYLETGSAIVGELNGYLYFVANYYDKGEQLWRVKVSIPKSSVEDTPQPELITVYPNPAKDYIQLELTKPMPLSIINSTGAKVKDYGLVTDGKLNVSEILPGVYFIVDEQGKNIAKFVKE
jgi:ELWxxDGT repeat protein